MYKYDTSGNLITVTDANGNIWKYQYDQLNRKIADITPSGNITSYSYDAVGNMVSRTDANGATTYYSYCPLNRIIRTDYPDGTYIVTGYDVCYCNPIRETFYAADGAVINGYTRTINAVGWTISKTTDYGSFSKTLDYTYEKNGMVKTVKTLGGSTVTYVYDDNDRVTSITDSAIGQIQYTYDVADRITSRTFGGVTTNYGYDTANRLTTVSTTAGESTWSCEYQLDQNGRRTSAIEQDPVWGTGTYTYEYDGAGRLTRVSYPWGNTTTYTYDAVGNRLSERIGKRIRVNEYDEDNRFIASTMIQLPGGYPTHWWAWEYDNNGNQIAQIIINGTTGPYYTYDYENRLTNTRLNPDRQGDTNVSYTYLPSGDRMSRINDTETIYYLYVRENVIAILDNSGNPIQTFLHGKGVDEPVAMKKGANAYYYVQDGLGSTVAIINTNDGSVAASYRYDAWGNVESCAGEIAVENPYLFTGREYDWQTGVYHYRARSYDAHLGRFLQRDPAGMVDGTNMYVYCRNDPVNGRDPTGMIAGLGAFDRCKTLYELCTIAAYQVYSLDTASGVLVGIAGGMLIGAAIGAPFGPLAGFTALAGAVIGGIGSVVYSTKVDKDLANNIRECTRLFRNCVESISPHIWITKSHYLAYSGGINI